MTRRCEFGRGCNEPAAYVITYEWDPRSFAACVDCTAEARANDPLEHIESVSSLRRSGVSV